MAGPFTTIWVFGRLRCETHVPPQALERAPAHRRVVVCKVFGWLSSVGTGVNMAFLRMLRIVRVGRFFRVFLRIRELYMLLAGLASSFKAILFGSMLLGLIWELVGGQLR